MAYEPRVNNVSSSIIDICLLFFISHYFYDVGMGQGQKLTGSSHTFELPIYLSLRHHREDTDHEHTYMYNIIISNLILITVHDIVIV